MCIIVYFRVLFAVFLADSLLLLISTNPPGPTAGLPGPLRIIATRS